MPVLIPLLGPKPLMQIRATPPDSNPDQSEATCAQARQRTLPSFRWPFPPPPHRLRSHRTCNERLRFGSLAVAGHTGWEGAALVAKV